MRFTIRIVVILYCACMSPWMEGAAANLEVVVHPARVAHANDVLVVPVGAASASSGPLQSRAFVQNARETYPPDEPEADLSDAPAHSFWSRPCRGSRGSHLCACVVSFTCLGLTLSLLYLITEHKL